MLKKILTKKIKFMKKLITFCLLSLFVFTSNAQELLTYTEVIQVDSVSKNELFYRAKNWFVNAFKSSKNVIQNENKENGEIIGKATMKYYPDYFVGSDNTKGYINYTIKIFVKEGRYKYEFTDFYHEPENKNGHSFGYVTNAVENPKPYSFSLKSWNRKAWNDLKKEIDIKMKDIIFSLKDGMKVKTEAQNDNW